ncbi:MAG: SMC family ATPase [Gemmatimonadetes bacterium]|nr:SMC family ATPase [Gemmatimonadota bacterium]MBI3568370.1 SMC family ATPase [Gemmatimonadota bacterium]
MRLNRLRLLNFRQHVDTEITFETGLTGIIGPNGVGKSTILEAVAWALYGGDTARGGKDSIRFARAAPRAQVRVELDFELAGHRYRVLRGLTMAEVYLDGGDQPIANSATAVGDLLQRRLGMTRTEFFNTYFTGQKELTVMGALSATERGQFLSRVLGYEKLRAAQDLADLRRRDLRNEIVGMRSGMPDADAVAMEIHTSEARVIAARRELDAAEAQRARLQAQIDALAPRWSEVQRQRDELQLLDADLRVTDIEFSAHQRNAERVTVELQHVAAAREALAPLADQLVPFHEVGNELGRLRELAVHDGRRQALLEQEKALGAELDGLREQHARVQSAPQLEEQVTLELETKRRALEDAQGALEARRTAWVRDRQEAETRRNALRGTYQELRDQREKLVSLGDAGTCPTCQRPLGDHYRQVLDLLDSQIETVSADGSYFRSRLEQLDAMPQDIVDLDEERRRIQGEVTALERRLARVQVNVHQLAQLSRDVTAKEQRHEMLGKELAAIPGGYDRARHQQLEAEFERLAALNTQANRLNTQVEREPSLKREQESIARSLLALAAKRDAVLSRRAALAVTEEEFAALRDQHTAVSAQLHAATLGAMNQKTEAALAQAALERAMSTREDLARVEQQLARLESEKRLHDELHRAYSDLRTDLNFAMRPELSELASAFLTELTDARYTELELDDKYRIVVLEDGVPKPVISGGEEDLANLVLRLAISQMIAERAGQAFSLLVLDEIFGSLDETRRHNVVELLRGLQDRFEQVILITHIEGVRDGLDQVIEVGFDEQTGAAVVRRGAGATFPALAGAAPSADEA